MEILPERYLWTRKIWYITCWKSSTSDVGFFWWILQHCKIGDFFLSLVTISGKKTDRTFIIILPEVYLWTGNSPLNFGDHPNSHRIHIY